MFARSGVRTGWLALGLLAVSLLVPSQVTGEEKEDPILAFVTKRAKDPNKPFTLLVIVKVKDGAGAKFETAFAKALTATRKEKGCITYDLNRDSDNPARYQVYERWKSVAELKAHLETAHIKALREVLPEVLDGAPELHVLFPASE